MGTSKSKNKTQKIKFGYFAPFAEEIFIAGSFNDWDKTSHPLKKDDEGNWTIKLDLALGRYEYRYVVDGDWQNEQDPGECVPNIYGTWNSVVEVK